MPGGDRTGPQGAGPMTGRGVGICAGYDEPGYMNGSFGRRFGRGRGAGMGGGRGWRHMYYATGLPGWARRYEGRFVPPQADPIPVRDDELAHLKEQAQYFKEALKDVEKRIGQLQQEPRK